MAAAPPYEELDFLRAFEDELTPDEKAVQSAVRSFVDRELMPIIAECFSAGRFPLEIVPLFGENGFLGANCDGHGCQSLGSVGYGLLNLELERCDSGVRSFVSVQSALSIYPLMAFGSEEQKARWVPLLAAGKAVGCFGLTEPDFGSNPGGMRTVAKKDGGDYVLHGRKMWITNGSIADFAIVWAKLESAESTEIRAFLVERGTPGYKAFDIKEKFSLRASITSELALEDVRVPAENMLPGTEVGLKAALSCLTQARYGIAWGAIGAANACYDEALRHARTRVQFDGKPIAGHQLVQMKLVTMAAEIAKAQLLCLRLAKLKESGALKHYHVSLAKMNNVEIARDSARLAREILGASGITYECQTGRHLCNMETVHTYEGTRDIHALIVGRELTGVSAIS